MYPELNEELGKLQASECKDQPNSETEVERQKGKTSLKGDRWNIALLTVLYTLQGMPTQLGHAIPIVLQKRGVTYSEQVSACPCKTIFTNEHLKNFILRISLKRIF